MQIKLIVLGFGLFTSATSSLLGTTSEVASSINNEVAHSTTTAVVERKIELYPELYKICSCESGGGKNGPPRHFDASGNVLRGKVNPHDVGYCQINTDYHLEAAQGLGFDIFTEEGNIGYANYLYDKQGSRPWNWSKPCWGN